MLKVIIQTDFTKSEVVDFDGEALPDLLELINQAIKGVGFYPPDHCHLDYVED